MTQDAGLPEVKMDREVEETLKNYTWPGNVRELSNVLERVLSSIEGDTIHVCDLPFHLYQKRNMSPDESRGSLKKVQERAEREAIRYALESSGYSKAQAAKILGIHRTLLYKKIKKYNLSLNRN